MILLAKVSWTLIKTYFLFFKMRNTNKIKQEVKRKQFFNFSKKAGTEKTKLASILGYSFFTILDWIITYFWKAAEYVNFLFRINSKLDIQLIKPNIT